MSKRSYKHSFNANVAEILSIEKAILLDEIFHWVKSNLLKNHQVFDGAAWTFNPAKSYAEKYPYMKEKSIYRWIKELENDGWIYSRDIYNKRKNDRTKWHTINLVRYMKAEIGVVLDPKDVENWVKSVEEKSISQNENWKGFLSQNENSISQNENSISQNERALPTSYQLPTIKEKNTKKEKKEIEELKAKLEQAQIQIELLSTSPNQQTDWAKIEENAKAKGLDLSEVTKEQRERQFQDPETKIPETVKTQIRNLMIEKYKGDKEFQSKMNRILVLESESDCEDRIREFPLFIEFPEVCVDVFWSNFTKHQAPKGLKKEARIKIENLLLTNKGDVLKIFEFIETYVKYTKEKDYIHTPKNFFEQEIYLHDIKAYSCKPSDSKTYYTRPTNLVTEPEKPLIKRTPEQVRALFEQANKLKRVV